MGRTAESVKGFRETTLKPKNPSMVKTGGNRELVERFYSPSEATKQAQYLMCKAQDII